jgi:TolB-like protein
MLLYYWINEKCSVSVSYPGNFSVREKLLLFICPLLLFSNAFSQSDARIAIAVNDLTATGVDQATATILSDRLRGELVNIGAFQVVERAEMETILKEQGFQQTGACGDSTSCLVKVGQLLGVQRMVAGSIGKVNDFWTISLRMLNVATGEILFTVSEDFQGDIKDIVSQVVAKAAMKLASGAGLEARNRSMAGKKGDLFLETSQPDATVEIDGMAIKGVTPITLQGFAAGDHRIVVRKGDWYGLKSITLNPDELLKVSIAMQLGTIKIFSTPPNARVFIDGKESGETPLKLDNLPPCGRIGFYQQQICRQYSL